MSAHLSVDAEESVARLEPFGGAFARCIGGLSHILQRLERRAREHVHRHVAAAAP
jgi:hypothetical protein